MFKPEKRKLIVKKLDFQNVLKNYENSLESIHKYFKYKEDWTRIPLENMTDHHWMLLENSDGSGKVVYFEKPFTKDNIEQGSVYSSSIYTQRFLPKWVYRTQDYTMISVDTHTDGNKFLMIFDNTLENNNPEFKKIYKEKWSEF